jgi:hypothetical protein
MAKGDMVVGKDGIMVKRPFDNAENDFQVSNKLGAHDADVQVGGIIASKCTDV